MLVFYCGLPGAGKSHDMVRTEVLPALEAGRLVVTNLPLNIERLAADFPRAFELIKIVGRDDEGRFPFSHRSHYDPYLDWKHPDNPGVGAVFIIDEARKSLPPHGEGTVTTDVIEVFVEHRHWGLKMVIGSQDFDEVNKSVRKLSEEVYAMKKLSFLGLDSHYWRRTYFGPHGPNGSRKPDKVVRLKYDPQIFQYYKSHMHGGGVVKEQRNKPWFMKKRFALVMGAALIALVNAFFSGPSAEEAARAARAGVSVGGTASGDASDVPRAKAAVDKHPFSGKVVQFGGLVEVGGAQVPMVYVDGRRVPVEAFPALGYRWRMLGDTGLLTHEDSGERWVFVLMAPGQTL